MSNLRCQHPTKQRLSNEYTAARGYGRREPGEDVLIGFLDSVWGELEDVQPTVAHEPKVLRRRYCEQRVVVGREGERVGVEGQRLEGVWHRRGREETSGGIRRRSGLRARECRSHAQRDPPLKMVEKDIPLVDIWTRPRPSSEATSTMRRREPKPWTTSDTHSLSSCCQKFIG